jgi:tRNA dimethylallyltransferase
VSDAVRQEATELLNEIGVDALFAKLRQEDPDTAANIDGQNPARVVRAWEVLRQTGRPLKHWQDIPLDGPPSHLAFFKLLIEPPREALYASADRRFQKMIDAGALEEVRALMEKAYPDDAPVKKALGYRPMESHLLGRMDLEEAARVSERDTRRYAKRQSTWFRNQYKPDEVLFAQYSESLDPEIRENIRQFLLTTQI